MTKVVTFFSQKGGCGKTSLSILSAGYLAYKLGLKVLAVDADFQQTFFQTRQDEMASLDQLKPVMKERGVGEPYPVISCDIKDAVATIRRERATGRYDVIFVDLPGSINDDNIMNAICECEYVIVPLEHNLPALKSSLTSASMIIGGLRRINGNQIKKVCGVFNRVPNTQVGRLVGYMNLINVVNLDYIFPSVIGFAHKMADANHVCTMLPPADEYLRQKGEKLNLGSFFDELRKVIEI